MHDSYYMYYMYNMTAVSKDVEFVKEIENNYQKWPEDAHLRFRPTQML